MKWIAEASPNIALIKYWGKKPSLQDLDRNLALNPSVSFTLSQAKTRVQISLANEFEFIVNHQIASAEDQKKILEHVQRIYNELQSRQLLKTPKLIPLKIDSSNNFPSGTGMASSASSFAALTTGLLGSFLGVSGALKIIESEGPWVSSLARRGSGSASRSMFGPWAQWKGPEASAIFSQWKLYDTVAIVSSEHKKYPSSFGHQAALSSPLLPERLSKISERFAKVISAIEKKSLKLLGPLIEEEALEMHHVAEAGSPSIAYLEESSRLIINALQAMPDRDFYFTVDAGPNIHLISERPIETEIRQLLAELGIKAKIWCDESGPGPSLREWHER